MWKHELIQFFLFLVWILATSLGCFKKWKIHESLVIIDPLPGKEANDLTYANKLISYLIQHFFNISKVNMDLKHNILLGCKWEKLCTANIFLSKWVCNKAILCSYWEVYKAGVICILKLNIIMQKFSLPNVLTCNTMTTHSYICVLPKRPDSTLFLCFA